MDTLHATSTYIQIASIRDCFPNTPLARTGVEKSRSRTANTHAMGRSCRTHTVTEPLIAFGKELTWRTLLRFPLWKRASILRGAWRFKRVGLPRLRSFDQKKGSQEEPTKDKGGRLPLEGKAPPLPVTPLEYRMPTSPQSHWFRFSSDPSPVAEFSTPQDQADSHSGSIRCLSRYASTSERR